MMLRTAALRGTRFFSSGAYLSTLDSLRGMINDGASADALAKSLEASNLETVEFFVRQATAEDERVHGISEEGLALLADGICAADQSQLSLKELIVYGEGLGEASGAALARVAASGSIRRIACYSGNLGAGVTAAGVG